MFIDGLETASIGMGMVFLALVIILATILTLRFVIELADRMNRARSCTGKSPQEYQSLGLTTQKRTPVSDPDKITKAASIAAAIYLAERDEHPRGE